MHTAVIQVKLLRRTLDSAGLHHTRIVAQDGGSQICTAMRADPALAAAIDVVGLHYPSDFGGVTPACQGLGKRIWASEESSSYDDLNGANCWARVVLLAPLPVHPPTHFYTRPPWGIVCGLCMIFPALQVHSHYVLSGITASIMWNLIGAYYPGTSWFASSLMTAVQPWSGHYSHMPAIWATAHVTQFAQVGWRYLKVGSGSGLLRRGG